MPSPIRTQRDAEALVQETVAFYSGNPRATIEGLSSVLKLITVTCAYQTLDGRKCAIGRCVKHPAAFQKEFPDTSIHKIGSETLEPRLRPKHRGYPIEFWSKLQHLHDTNQFWGKTGLSFEGSERVKRILEWIKVNSGLPA